MKYLNVLIFWMSPRLLSWRQRSLALYFSSPLNSKFNDHALLSRNESEEALINDILIKKKENVNHWKRNKFFDSFHLQFVHSLLFYLFIYYLFLFYKLERDERKKTICNCAIATYKSLQCQNPINLYIEILF